MPEEEFSVRSESPENIRKVGHSYDSFLYQTLLDCGQDIRRAAGSSNVNSNLMALASVMQIHFALGIKCRNKTYWEETYLNAVKALKDRVLTAANSPQNQKEFLLNIFYYLDKIAIELRHIGFSPPKATQVVAEFVEKDATTN